MDRIAIPAAGLTLQTIEKSDHLSKSVFERTQVIQLNLSNTILEEVLREARTGGKDGHVCFGKAPALLFGKRTHKLTSTIQNFSTDLYKLSSHEDDRLSLVGSINHKLEMKKYEDVAADLDPALLALQSSMAEAKRKKESNTTVFVKDSSTLPPAKGGKRAPAKASSQSLLKHRIGLFDKRPIARSTPASPSLSATRSPLLNATTTVSGPPSNKISPKTEALKVALLHVLAIRPVSQKFLASSVNCTKEDCTDILEKYGRPARLDPEKYDLSDRGYKELDIWSFPYKHPDDRQAAIDRAVSAYDRQRLSREEKLWQLLLPKADRNKGIILSKLQLHNGPIQRVSTPRINVEHTDDSGKGDLATGSEDEKRQGRLTPGDADPGLKKKRISEKEAQSKRLLSKNPKKATQATTIKEKRAEAAKSNESQPEVVKSMVSKPEDTNAKGSKPAKKKEGKAETPTSNAKVKSAEFIRESDEDVEMEDAITIAAAPTKPKGTVTDNQATATNLDKKQAVPPVTSTKPNAQSTLESKKPSLTPVAAAGKATVPPTSSSSGSGQRVMGGPAAVPMKKTSSHQRNTSSPIKPSPLGSSPPTNASDLDQDDQSQQGISSVSSANVSPDKDLLKGVAPKVDQPMQNSSESTLKRKADDIDSDLHAHGGASLTHKDDRPAKRQQTVANSPTLSDSSSSSDDSPAVSRQTIELARKFKEYWIRYEKVHRELSTCINPAQDRVDQLLKMHARLETMKAEINKGIVS